MLKALDIEYAAFNPGATFRGLHDSIVNHGGNRSPEVIFCCDEEYSVDIASGYARVTGKPMAAIVHNMVGLLHATMAIFNAWVDRTPVLVLGSAGPMDIERRRHWIDWIHSSVDQGGVVRDYVKWDEQTTSLTGAIDSLLRGYQLANTAPKGPVYLSFDTGQQEDEINRPVAIPDVSRYCPPAPVQGNHEALQKVAELMVEAEQPVVLADYLSREPGAVEALVELAELLSLPVIDCGNMLSFPNTHPLDLLGAEKELLSQADLVLSINVFDLSQALSGFSRDAGASPVREDSRIIDISLRHFPVRSWVHDFGKLPPIDIAISADPYLAVSSLTKLCRELLAQKPENEAKYRERLGELKAKHQELHENWQSQAERAMGEKPIAVSWLHRELWDIIKDEDWVLTHQGLSSWARKLWNWDKPYRYVGSRMGAGLGYGLGTSVGSALACRSLNRLCIDFQPDGDFLFNNSCLWTAAHHAIPLLLIMYNNRSYFNSEQHQATVAKARGRPIANSVIGTRIETPFIDYAGLARSFGVHGEGPIEDPKDLRPALDRAVNYIKDKKQPVLVDVVTQMR
jgi:thiamine pyrophosphate-dependent acetolactate synthase large subunit-like protein